MGARHPSWADLAVACFDSLVVFCLPMVSVYRTNICEFLTNMRRSIFLILILRPIVLSNIINYFLRCLGVSREYCARKNRQPCSRIAPIHQPRRSETLLRTLCSLISWLTCIGQPGVNHTVPLVHPCLLVRKFLAVANTTVSSLE
jgi:hypothetical protein